MFRVYLNPSAVRNRERNIKVFSIFAYKPTTLKLKSSTPVPLKHSQFEAAIDAVFNHLLTKVPIKIQSKGNKVAILKIALQKNQCYSDDEKFGNDTALNNFGRIAKGVKKNKDSRAVLITWLVDVDKGSCQLLKLREKVEGVQILLRLGKATTPVESKDAVEWFKQLCLKPNGDFKNPGPVSLYNSIFEALEMEYIEKISEANVSDGKELHKKLEKSMLEKPLDLKIIKECLPGNTSWPNYVRNHHGLPFCLLYAPKELSVNIRLLCFPSYEEIYFYSPNSVAGTIDLGLIGDDQFVPLFKVTQADDGGKIKRLKKEIITLRAEIERLKLASGIKKRKCRIN
ncbi:unnamed protein product [Mytilus coruscus]|uniref:Uncharacterized protein n=1 Tax=Mytilus coruscus TaxID=42192 RepID=A0A6J8DAC3_MYTCO|nr:unnamed protein product [Mytilus coruscus]